MKVSKIGIVAAIVAMVGLSTQAQAGLWEKMTTMGDKKVESKAFNIEASGWNLRAVTFEHPYLEDTVCTFVSGTRKGGLDCVKVKKENK